MICLVTEEIPTRIQEKLTRLGGGRLSFRYIPLKGRLEGVYTDPRYTEAASFRLLLPELLPEWKSLLPGWAVKEKDLWEESVARNLK